MCDRLSPSLALPKQIEPQRRSASPNPLPPTSGRKRCCAQPAASCAPASTPFSGGPSKRSVRASVTTRVTSATCPAAAKSPAVSGRRAACHSALPRQSRRAAVVARDRRRRSGGCRCRTRRSRRWPRCPPQATRGRSQHSMPRDPTSKQSATLHSPASSVQVAEWNERRANRVFTASVRQGHASLPAVVSPDNELGKVFCELALVGGTARLLQGGLIV